MKKIRKDERGYIALETIGSFVPLFLLISSILLLVDVAATQARVHYALTQTAEEMSIYSYLAEKGTDEQLFAGEFFTVVNGLISLGQSGSAEANGAMSRKLSAANDFESCAEMIFDMYVRKGHSDILIYNGFDGITLNALWDGGEITLTCVYQIDFRFFGIVMPFGFLEITQTAATKAWSEGNGKGLNFFR